MTKRVKTRGDNRKACKPGGRKFGMEINFVLFFQIHESYETKFSMKISSFTVHDKLFLHQILLLSHLVFFPFLSPPPPCLFFTDQATRQISTDATCVQSQQQPKPGHSSCNHRSSQRSPFTCVIFSSLHCLPSSAILFPVAFNIKLKKNKNKWKAVCVLFNYFSFLISYSILSITTFSHF